MISPACPMKLARQPGFNFSFSRTYFGTVILPRVVIVAPGINLHFMFACETSYRLNPRASAFICGYFFLAGPYKILPGRSEVT